MISIELLAYIGVVLGVLLAAVFPWLKKNADLVAEGKQPEKFRAAYFYSLAMQLIVTVLVIIAALASYEPPEGTVGALAVFFSALTFGAMASRSLNIPVDFIVAYLAARKGAAG